MPEIKIIKEYDGIKCAKCGYEWIPRVKNPKKCPECQSRNWMGEKLKSE